MTDFARALPIPSQMEFMAVSSYGSSTSSSGVVRILKDLDKDIAGRHVLIVEDIIDSGLTLSWLMRNLKTRNPASLEVVTLLPQAGRGQDRRRRPRRGLRHPQRVRRRFTASTTPSGTAICRTSAPWTPRSTAAEPARRLELFTFRHLCISPPNGRQTGLRGVARFTECAIDGLFGDPSATTATATTAPAWWGAAVLECPTAGRSVPTSDHERPRNCRPGRGARAGAGRHCARPHFAGRRSKRNR